MADIKTVIKTLDHCIRSQDCLKCEYLGKCKYLDKDVLELLKEQQEKIDGLLEDLATAIDDKESALLMLKEQQPVKPIQFEKRSKITRDKYECGACGSSEIYKEWDFCPWCGKPIDWTKAGEQECR